MKFLLPLLITAFLPSGKGEVICYSDVDCPRNYICDKASQNTPQSSNCICRHQGVGTLLSKFVPVCTDFGELFNWKQQDLLNSNSPTLDIISHSHKNNQTASPKPQSSVDYRIVAGSAVSFLLVIGCVVKVIVHCLHAKNYISRCRQRAPEAQQNSSPPAEETEDMLDEVAVHRTMGTQTSPTFQHYDTTVVQPEGHWLLGQDTTPHPKKPKFIEQMQESFTTRL